MGMCAPASSGEPGARSVWRVVEAATASQEGTRRGIGRFFQDGGEHAQPGSRFRLGREEDIHLAARARGKSHGAESEVGSRKS